MKIYSDALIDRDAIAGKRVVVLGFGAQGRAQALNLRDAGADVAVGLRPGSASGPACRQLGLDVVTLDQAADADIVVMLVPDQEQPGVYRDHLAERLRPGGMLVFAHGYNIHYGRIEIRDDIDVVLVAPLGIGDQVRRQYELGQGVPALLAIHQDASGQALPLALAYASADGHGRAAILMTTFAEETETDLFAEQAVLCGGITNLITAAFDTLTDAGYSKEVAYFCCLHEVKLMADMIHARGIAGMRESISATAEFGDYTRGPRVIDDKVKETLRDLLDEIRNGDFSRELDGEIAAGLPTISAGRAKARAHSIETAGKTLRGLMPWLAGRPGGE